ncbi:unnamed protein product [Cyprideis torosa]|uniref:Uncharacterized protein n=1 Tax=Cyprideis torosa TaxID=163714 RepID=A0A7R8ZQF3_9CRUS|nr:unnamed protein product [Cyprideis torosa]CAG0890535.1 unnamed protein product [Cyprideis torosa]
MDQSQAEYERVTANLENEKRIREAAIGKNVFFAALYHLSPLTPIPLVLRIIRSQGLTVAFRGASNVAILTALDLWLCDLVANVTGWPGSWPFRRVLSTSAILSHLFVKASATIVLIPFSGAALVETVSSWIASDRPGPLDMFSDGITRHFVLTPRRGQVSFWILIAPSLSYSLGSHIVQQLVGSSLKSVMSDSSGEEDPYLLAVSITLASFAADVIMYPMQTILNRLYLQGTRTIVDSVDESCGEVLAIITRYQGVEDCYNNIVKTEGPAGLFKGFGSLLLQYAVQLTVLKLAHSFWCKMTERPPHAAADETVAVETAPPPSNPFVGLIGRETELSENPSPKSDAEKTTKPSAENLAQTSFLERSFLITENPDGPNPQHGGPARAVYLRGPTGNPNISVQSLDHLLFERLLLDRPTLLREKGEEGYCELTIIDKEKLSRLIVSGGKGSPRCIFIQV